MNLEIEACFDRMLGSVEFDTLQEVLCTFAADWSSRVRIQAYDRDNRRAVDLHEDVSALRDITAVAGERGSTYQAMVDAYGTEVISATST